MEAPETLFVVVGTDAGIDPIVPVVEAADEIATSDVAVGEEGAAVEATPVEDGVVFSVADHYKIDAFDEHAYWLSIR